jgi:hypothetical protein
VDHGIEAARDSEGDRTVIVVDEEDRHWSRGYDHDRGRVTSGFLGEGIGRNRRGGRNASDNGCSKQQDGSTRHDKVPFSFGLISFRAAMLPRDGFRP